MQRQRQIQTLRRRPKKVRIVDCQNIIVETEVKEGWPKKAHICTDTFRPKIDLNLSKSSCKELRDALDLILEQD